MLQELRIYRLHPGKREAMRERFQGFNRTLFERHGIGLVSAWLSPDDENAFVFLLTFPDRAARELAWKAYHDDPEWIAQREEQQTIIAGITLYLLDPLEL